MDIDEKIIILEIVPCLLIINIFQIDWFNAAVQRKDWLVRLFLPYNKLQQNYFIIKNPHRLLLQKNFLQDAKCVFFEEEKKSIKEATEPSPLFSSWEFFFKKQLSRPSPTSIKKKATRYAFLRRNPNQIQKLMMMAMMIVSWIIIMKGYETWFLNTVKSEFSLKVYYHLITLLISTYHNKNCSGFF